MIPSNYTEKMKEYKKIDPALCPKLVYWPLTNTYMVTIQFSNAHIESRGMEVIDAN